MKKMSRKLQLRKETLRNISSEQLQHVIGGDTGSLSCGGPDCEPADDTTWYRPPENEVIDNIHS